MKLTYDQIVTRRKALRIDGYATLEEATRGTKIECNRVTPYQRTSHSADGPVLVALHWLDEASIHDQAYLPDLERTGYLPCMRFNKVLDIALRQAGLDRADVYLTQAFHLIPPHRSAKISASNIAACVNEVTQHEMKDRYVIALGSDAGRACHHFRSQARQLVTCCHPSRRGYPNEVNATEIAAALAKAADELGCATKSAPAMLFGHSVSNSSLC